MRSILSSSEQMAILLPCFSWTLSHIGRNLNSMTHRRQARFFYRDWISVFSEFFGSQTHTVNRIATTITRPKFSISVRYFHLRLEEGERGWGIRVSHSEVVSNSHQPQT
jgi:thiaminase